MIPDSEQEKVRQVLSQLGFVDDPGHHGFMFHPETFVGFHLGKTELPNIASGIFAFGRTEGERDIRSSIKRILDMK